MSSYGRLLQGYRPRRSRRSAQPAPARRTAREASRMSRLLDETSYSELSSSSSALAASDLDATRLSPLFDSRSRQIPGSFPSGRGNTRSNSATYAVAHPVTLTTP